MGASGVAGSTLTSPSSSLADAQVTGSASARGRKGGGEVEELDGDELGGGTKPRKMLVWRGRGGRERGDRGESRGYAIDCKA
jgi:hypothetical protein